MVVTMLRVRHIVALIAALSIVSTLSAQTLLSRGALDSLMRPRLSSVAEGAITVDSRIRDLGTIDQRGIVRVSYTLYNELTTAIDITTVKASCSCLRITSQPATIAPNGSYTLTAEFNPAGRSSSFDYDIVVYTSLDAEHPTERLRLKGEVEASETFAHLRYSMGALRLSRKSVTIDGIKPNATRRESIAVANSGTRALSITARSTTEGLSLRCEPAVLEPNAEGHIIVEYRTAELPARDIETILIVEGVEAAPAERMIRITIKR